MHSDDGLKDAYICVFNPEAKRAELFGQYVLPFGACASVHGFCRTSFGLWAIGVRLLHILWTVYFDDFVVFEERALSRHCEFVVLAFFKMLGWATSIDKENDFDCSLKALGIVIDLSDVKLLKVRFANTDERRFEVWHDIRAILETGQLGRSEGQRIRGRLLFAESQIHGRRSIRQMQSLSKHIHTCSSSVLDAETKGALEFLCNKLEAGQSRYISPLATEIIVMPATSLTVRVQLVLGAFWFVQILGPDLMSVSSLDEKKFPPGILLAVDILSTSLS